MALYWAQDSRSIHGFNAELTNGDHRLNELVAHDSCTIVNPIRLRKRKRGHHVVSRYTIPIPFGSRLQSLRYSFSLAAPPLAWHESWKWLRDGESLSIRESWFPSMRRLSRISRISGQISEACRK
jgi:hypothetical protein